MTKTNYNFTCVTTTNSYCDAVRMVTAYNAQNEYEKTYADFIFGEGIEKHKVVVFYANNAEHERKVLFFDEWENGEDSASAIVAKHCKENNLKYRVSKYLAVEVLVDGKYRCFDFWNNKNMHMTVFYYLT